MYPLHLSIEIGLHLKLAIEGKYKFICYSFSIIYTYISEYNGRPQKHIFLTLFRLLLMQYKWMLTKHFILSTPPRKYPKLWQQSQICASLAAIARYITMIFTIGICRFSKHVTSFHRSIAIATNETTNYDFILHSALTQKSEINLND